MFGNIWKQNRFILSHDIEGLNRFVKVELATSSKNKAGKI